MAEKSKSFRINAQGFFLTYPQCPILKEEAHTQLGQLGTIVNGVIAREQHEDGHHHLHAYVRYNKKMDIRRDTYFDLK